MGLSGYLLLALSVAAGLAAAVGGLMLTLQPPNYDAARFAFMVAALCFGLLGVIWGVSETDQSITARLIAAGTTAAVAAIALVYVLSLLQQPSAAPPSLTPAQLQDSKLKDLADFLAKDENGLRQTFDIQGVLARNIEVQNIRIGFRKSGKIALFKYNHYTEGDGSFIMLAMEGKYHFAPSGGPIIDEGPHDVLFLITTSRFQVATGKLTEFLNSALVPEAIKFELSEFKKTVDKDMELMTRTLNANMNKGDDYFLKSNEYGTRYYGAINNSYFSAFLPFKPQAAAVVAAISKHWQTN